MLVSLMLTAFAAAPSDVYTLGPDGLPVVASDLDAPFPVDPGVRHGELPNGLTWYVERNPRPQRRAELRMIVNVGSILETDEQRGVAHFLEHMAFNGSKHFPADSAIVAIERFGARFGAHVNASTGFDHTIYELQVPTDDPRAVETALRVFADQAGALTFDPLECAREERVVQEEWRLDQGLPQRVQDHLTPLLFAGSPYVERSPIGTTDRRPEFDCDEARAFWQAWYRPELMAVAVVGDVDVKRTERLIRKLFAGLRGPAGAPERVWHRVPDHDAPLVDVMADPEIPDTTLTLLDKVDVIEQPYHRAYRAMFLEQMAFMALNERLAVLLQQTDAPFVYAYVDMIDIGHERGGQTLNVSPKEGREQEALRVAYAEVERARRFGFTPGEIERARRQLALGLQQYYTERETTDSGTHIEEIIRVFTTNEPMPGIPYEYAMGKAYLPGITEAEVDAWAREHLFTGRSRVVSLLMPEKPGLPVPSGDALLAVVQDVHTSTLTPPPEDAEERPLVAERPAPGTATQLAADPELGTTTWRLSNGATVILKTTDFQADEVLLQAFSPGGTSLVSDEDYIPAITATRLAARSGLGEHSAVDLFRLLSGRRANLEPFIGGLVDGLSGDASQDDLELLLQQVWLTFAAPRFDPEVEALERARREEDLRNRAASPDAVLWDTYTDLLWKGDERYTNWDVEDLAELDIAASERVFRERFASPGDWTFVFVGSVDAETLLPLVTTWIGSLPDDGRREVPQDDGARMVEGAVERTVSSGGTPRAHVILDFHGPFEPTPERRDTLSAVGEVLQSALSEELREDRGGTYGVGVDTTVVGGPWPHFNVTIDFACDPGRVDELIEATWDIIDLVKRERVLDQGIAVMRSQRAHDREVQSHDNGWWAGQLATLLQRGQDPRDLLRFDAQNAALNADAIRDMARRVLDRRNVLRVVQRPGGG